MEEEIAFLIEAMRLNYQDIYDMPYSRRQRLILWKEQRMREQQIAQERAAKRSR
jgi:hypothetical protein